jgi:exopolyphosphatase/guanosine-5'-triphosphate,3'-diphosphate pyrophosphatase
VVDVKGEAIGGGITLPLGGLRLDDMSKGSIAEAGKIIGRELKRATVLEGGEGRTFYCVGGTWRNLARLHMAATGYPLAVMHHYEMDVEGSANFLKQVARGEVEKMKGIERVSKSRRALLAYGAAVLQEIIRVMKPGKIVVSALGVREGFLYSLLSPDEQRTDPLISASEELALLRARSVTHAHELTDWTSQSFAAFGIDETEDEMRYRRAACLLADIGWRAHPEYRGVQSLNIIAHASFIGVDHPGRAFIALANLYRHEGLIDDAAAPEIIRLAPPRYVERARLLGAMLRVVYLLSASMPGIIPRLRWEKSEDGSLTLIVPSSQADLIGERPSGRLAALGRITGKSLRMAVGD